MLLEIELAAMSNIWGLNLGLGALGLIISAFRWWLGIPTLLFLTLFSFGWLLGTHFETPDFIDAINRQDPNYILLSDLAMAVGFLLQFTGVAIYLARRRKAL
jgi:hypothetical protein